MYDGGHLIGTLFQGPAEKINIVPQLKDQNRFGEWREMEKEWAKELDKDNEVEVEISVTYDGDNTSPKTLFATYMVDDNEPIEKEFDN